MFMYSTILLVSIKHHISMSRGNVFNKNNSKSAGGKKFYPVNKKSNLRLACRSQIGSSSLSRSGLNYPSCAYLFGGSESSSKLRRQRREQQRRRINLLLLSFCHCLSLMSIHVATAAWWLCFDLGLEWLGELLVLITLACRHFVRNVFIDSTISGDEWSPLVH